MMKIIIEVVKNMEKLKTFLEELGYKKNEVDVYTTLLTMGESTVLQISKKVGVHRSNIYEALDNLIKKGLVSSIENPVKKYFPRNPKCLSTFIKSKEIELGEISQELENKTFSSCETRIGKTTGKLAFKDALFNLLELKTPIYIYGRIPNGDAGESIRLAFDLFHRERIRRKLNLKLIYHSHSDSKNIKKNKFTLTKKFPLDYNSDLTTFICSNKVVIINWTYFTIIEIDDKDIANDNARYFEALWQSI